MSETVYYTGKLTKVACVSVGAEDQAREIMAVKGKTERDSYNDTWLEQLLDDCYGEYVVIEGRIYAVERQKKDADDDIFLAEKNEDGSISFTVKYYNGGCSFNEAIVCAMENLADKI